MYKKPNRYGSKTRAKKYIRTFRDLEVYQTTEQLSVDIMTQITPEIDVIDYPSKNKLVEAALGLPLLIAKAYSFRYDDKTRSHRLLQDAMNSCDEVTVYLEQVRDIFAENIDEKTCNDIIKSYTYVRRKMLNLKKVWEKWDAKDKVNLGRREEGKVVTDKEQQGSV